ncbi:MAG TPA: sigma-70 family RNA polymerase sigma factor [Planctomycetaceae bacterium]|nr:sigma-70 family RNA polymerase sigma factor [Planctomycetaceae bacterium]
MRNPDDDEAWQDFVRVYSPLIYNYCRSRHVQAQDAADITQEVLLRVNRAIASFEYSSKRGLFRDWLARIVRNELSRYVGKKRTGTTVQHSQHEFLEEPGASGEDGSLWQEHFQQHILNVALERTKPQFETVTWRLFTQAWVEQKNAADVAEEQSVGVDQVYVAKSRVLKRLRQEVSRLAEENIG